MISEAEKSVEIRNKAKERRVQLKKQYKSEMQEREKQKEKLMKD